MKISELSRKTGVSPRMLRFYEQLGLIKSKRHENEYRSYTNKHCGQVLKIREWQRLGLSLKEIQAINENPEKANAVFENVFLRERQVYLEKKMALQDLREKWTKQYPRPLTTRTAYKIPELDQIVCQLEYKGWKNESKSLIKFIEWERRSKKKESYIGEIIQKIGCLFGRLQP